MTFRSYDDVIDELERDMRRVSDEMLLQMFRISTMTGVWAPRVDVYETVDAIVVKVSAAGLEPGQIELLLSGDGRFLTLRGVRIENDDDKDCRVKYHQLEIYYGPFERIVQLPIDITVDRDSLTANYKDGFLKVVLPKTRQSEPKKIAIEE